jgi:hypothetical protein
VWPLFEGRESSSILLSKILPDKRGWPLVLLGVVVQKGDYCIGSDYKLINRDTYSYVHIRSFWLKYVNLNIVSIVSNSLVEALINI